MQEDYQRRDLGFPQAGVTIEEVTLSQNSKPCRSPTPPEPFAPSPRGKSSSSCSSAAGCLSALVRPLMWLAVFAAGFYNVFGVSIIPPYKTYITYQVYIVPGLLGIILLFHGMQSSLSMVYDREMGVMRLLLTAPLPRWVLLACKLVAGTALSVITCYVFLAVCILFDVTFEWSGWLYVLPALIVSGLMLGALWLFLSVYIRQVENFAGAMNFVMFPMFFFSSALYPLVATARGRLGVSLSRIARQSLHLCGRVDPVRALRHVRADIRAGRRRVDGGVLSAGGQGLRSPARHVPPHRTAGMSLNSAAIVRGGRKTQSLARPMERMPRAVLPGRLWMPTFGT